MRILSTFAAGALALLTAVPATAEMRVYPVPTNANYCPAGLQPITLNGVICCGKPNTHVTWYEMKKHPVSHARVATRNCPVGEKGC
ncbi:MAG: hypothetical protein RIG84_09405 [Roseovarius sp.]